MSSCHRAVLLVFLAMLLTACGEARGPSAESIARQRGIIDEMRAAVAALDEVERQAQAQPLADADRTRVDLQRLDQALMAARQVLALSADQRAAFAAAGGEAVLNDLLSKAEDARRRLTLRLTAGSDF